MRVPGDGGQATVHTVDPGEAELDLDSLPYCDVQLLRIGTSRWRAGVIVHTKLTLRLDDRLIESAKRYSARSGKSVSRIVADYFAVIQNERMNEGHDLTPVVRTLKGLLKNRGVSEADYHGHLEKKHL